MNKTEKRQLNLRNKLLAAIAMLLVSSIMMVSSTYAWFTLSTAPEVQGITTTVGANGNLEIALSPYSGDAADITSAMGDANLNWDKKNLTWGNLLNLSDNSTYGLGDITLLPAALNVISSGALADAPLSTPVYGADGRPQGLNTNTIIGSKIESVDAGGNITYSSGFVSGDTPYYGVRAVGTSETMTEWEIVFNSALSDLASSVSASKTAAQNSLNNNGSALSDMMMAYGLSATDYNYGAQKDTIGNILAELTTANEYLANAIKAALLAEAAAKPAEGESFNDDRYAAAVAALTDAADINAVTTYWTTYGDTHNSMIGTTIDLCKDIATKLLNANTELTKVPDSTTSFDDIKPVLSIIMNTTGVTINGFTVEKLNTTEGKNSLANSVTKGGITVKLGSSSGVYADIGSAVGNLSVKITIPSISYGGLTLTDVPATMVTDSEPEAAPGGYMPTVRTAIATKGAYAGDGNAASSKVINVPYAYIVDFLFRTNASGSSLKLQTTDAQRVYEDSTSSATQGSGSQMTFNVTDALSLDATKNLMQCIRVVFTDTSTKQILGVGKLVMPTTIAEGATSIVADLYLYEYTVSEIMKTTTDDSGVTTQTGTGNYQLVVSDTQIPEANALLCGLNANTAKGVSAMVYLEGEKVTNADVANGNTSCTGTLNLQFASTAELVPMENSALHNMTEAGQYSTELKFNGMTVNDDRIPAIVTASDTLNVNLNDVATAKSCVITGVTVTMGSNDITSSVYDEDTGLLNITEINGNISISITATETSSGS